MRKDQNTGSGDRLIVQAADQPMVPQGRMMFISYPDFAWLSAAVAVTMNALESGCTAIVMFQSDADVAKFRYAIMMIGEDICRVIDTRHSDGGPIMQTLRVRYADQNPTIQIQEEKRRVADEREPKPGEPGNHYNG